MKEDKHRNYPVINGSVFKFNKDDLRKKNPVLY